MFDFYRASLTPFLIRKQPGKINVTIGLYVNKKDAFVLVPVADCPIALAGRMAI